MAKDLRHTSCPLWFKLFLLLMLHVELVSTAGAGAFLLGKLDVFIGNIGERGDQENAVEGEG